MSLMAPVWGALADRFGRKAMLVRSMLGGAALIAAMGFVGDVWQLLVLRVVQGGVTGSQSAASALVAATAPSRHLGFALGLVNTAVQLGNSIGPAFGGLIVGGLGFRGSFILGGILLAMGGFMVLFWVEEPRDARRLIATSRTRDLAGDSNWLTRMLKPFMWPRLRSVLLLQVGTQFAFSASFALIPIYLQEMARPEWLSTELASGLAVTFTAVAAAMVMPFLGRWTDKHAPKSLLIISLIGVACVLVPQALVPNVALFLVLRVAMGLCSAGVTVALGVLTKLAAPTGREGAAYGAAGSAQAFGWGLGPMLGSAFAAVAGVPALFLFCALLVGSLVAPAAHSRR
jgi:MFS family permease